MNESLVICNGDQMIKSDLNSILGEFSEKNLDAGTIVFNSVHPRWSYVRCSDEGLVIEVEKNN